jgi:hypothetical protein
VIDPTVHTQLAQATAGGPLQTVVIQGPPITPEMFGSATTKRERLNRAMACHEQFRQHLARNVPMEDLQVVDLAAVGQIVITAPVEKLRQLLSPGGWLDTDPQTRVLPNAPSFATA